jgi:hypothetical protein
MIPPLNNQQMLQGLGNVLSTPLARGAIRYWWVSLPLGALGWHYWNQQKKKGHADIGQLVHDMMPAIGVVGTLLTINTLLATKEAKMAANPSVLPPGPIKDAEFTPGPVAAEIASR